MKTIKLSFDDRCAISNGVDDANNPILIDRCNVLNEMYTAVQNGHLYIQYISGDRQGSVAKAVFDDRYQNGLPKIQYKCTQYGVKYYSIVNAVIYMKATWKGRSNKPRVTTNCLDVIFIISQDPIETIWKMVNKKEVKAEKLAVTVQYDIDGNVLSVGDEVLYINARYGSAMTMCHGIIKEFKVTGSNNKYQVLTIIESKMGELSSLSMPSTMVYKK